MCSLWCIELVSATWGPQVNLFSNEAKTKEKSVPDLKIRDKLEVYNKIQVIEQIELEGVNES